MDIDLSSEVCANVMYESKKIKNHICATICKIDN